MHMPLRPTLALILLLGSHASAQAPALPPEDTDPPIAPVDVHNHDHEPIRRIEVPEHINQVTNALREIISAEFLTDDERLNLRVKHGVWSHDDLINRDHAAQAALDAGAYDHPYLLDPNADPLLLADAAITRGDPRRAIGFINSIDEPLNPQGLVLLAQAHETLGQLDEALDALTTLETLLLNNTLDDADQIAWGAQGMLDLLRLRGPQVDARAEYESITKLLASARENLDRTSWRVRLIESQLLNAHNNYQDGRNAAAETLLLHPRNAQAAFIIGSMAVDSFDFDTAEEIANKLDILAASVDESFDPENYTPPSLLGSILRARVALRRKDPEGAEIALDMVLARMPNQRDLLEINAAASAAGFRTTSTKYLLDAYDEISPNSPNAYMRVAETLSEYRQYEHAAESYRRVIERAPHWGEPRLGLGLLLVQAGLDTQARVVLEDALKLDPFDLRAQNSLTLVTELATYDTIESEHFIIRYKPDTTDIVLAREMPAIMERIHERVAGDAPGGNDYEPNQKTLIELMPNHEWFAVRIGGMPSIHTMAASTGPVIAIEAPRDGPKSSIGPYDWHRVLQHEYTHTVNLARTKNRVIHWMTEANAVFNEDSPRDANTWALLTNAYKNDELFDLVEINTAFVRPKKPTDRSQAYAQGAWMFEYIVETYGPQAPLDIFDASTRGRDAVDAFEEVLKVTPESFLASFKEWAKQDLIEHNLLLPDDVPDIYEILGVSDDDSPEEQLNKVPTRDEIAKLLEQYPDHPELITLQIGAELAGADDTLTDRQIEILEHAITVRPTDPEPHKRLVRHYRASADGADQLRAIPHLEYLDAREIHSPAYAGELALLYAQRAEHDKAIRAALRAVAIAPFDADQRERAARVALIAENFELAKHQLESLIILEPDREVHVRRLEALMSRVGG